MQELVDPSDRKPAEIAAFALVAFGNIVGTAGVITTTVWVAIFGALCILIGAVALYFLEQ
jgi:hypothetical protein